MNGESLPPKEKILFDRMRLDGSSPIDTELDQAFFLLADKITKNCPDNHQRELALDALLVCRFWALLSSGDA